MDTINARIKAKIDTTASWNLVGGSFTPLKGEVIIYSDYQTVDGKVIAGIKVGTGNAYVGDLPFVDEDVRDKLLSHITDTSIHVTTAEKNFWSNKVNIDDSDEIVNGTLNNETLIFTRL